MVLSHCSPQTITNSEFTPLKGLVLAHLGQQSRSSFNSPNQLVSTYPRPSPRQPPSSRPQSLPRQYPARTPSNMSLINSLLIASFLLIGAAQCEKPASPQPGDSCAQMTLPATTQPQKSKSPFVIHIDKLRLKPGESTEVSVAGIKGETSKEFLLQARVGRTPLGQFVGNKDAKVIDCGNGKQNGVVSTDSSDKKEIKVTWTAPKDLKSQVIFYLTILDSKGNYWVQQRSRTLNVG